MTFNDLLKKEHVDPRRVVVLRHRPNEPGIRRVLPWLAAERPEMFNAYQQTQGPRLESAMQRMVGSGFVASFIGDAPGRAVFVGLYSIVASKRLTFRQYWNIPAYVAMKEFGLRGWTNADARKFELWFDLVKTGFYQHWQGKLILKWPPPERSWWRRAHRNEIQVGAVLDDSVFGATMPNWSALELSWADLDVLPTAWRAALSQRRGIYYIFDASDRKGYVDLVRPDSIRPLGNGMFEAITLCGERIVGYPSRARRPATCPHCLAA